MYPICHLLDKFDKCYKFTNNQSKFSSVRQIRQMEQNDKIYKSSRFYSIVLHFSRIIKDEKINEISKQAILSVDSKPHGSYAVDLLVAVIQWMWLPLSKLEDTDLPQFRKLQKVSRRDTGRKIDSPQFYSSSGSVQKVSRRIAGIGI